MKHDKPIPHKTTGKGKTYNPTDKGAGMTAKGRAEYNAKNNANLKPPAPNPKTKADAGRKASFCARMEGVVKNAKGPAERWWSAARCWPTSDEFVTALCQKCHYEVDQGKTLSKEEKSQMWHNAHMKTKEMLDK